MPPEEDRGGLEEEADGHLHLAFGGEAGSGDATEVGVGRVGVGVGEGWCVGHVIDFSPKFCAEALGEMQCLEEGDIARGEAGAVERVALDVPVCAGRGLREVAGEPLAADAMRQKDGPGGVGSETVAAAEDGVDDAEGGTGLRRNDGVELPAA